MINKKDENYIKVQNILLRWGDGRRPLSGEINEILDWNYRKEVEVIKISARYCYSRLVKLSNEKIVIAIIDTIMVFSAFTLWFVQPKFYPLFAIIWAISFILSIALAIKRSK